MKEAEQILLRSENRIKENKQKKWIVAIIFMILGSVLGYYIPVLTYTLSYSVYDRTDFDIEINSMFGGASITNALTDEVLILAYSYNQQ